MVMHMGVRVPYTLLVDEDLLKRARKYAVRYRLTTSSVFRMALVDFLERHENEPPAEGEEVKEDGD